MSMVLMKEEVIILVKQGLLLWRHLVLSTGNSRGLDRTQIGPRPLLLACSSTPGCTAPWRKVSPPRRSSTGKRDCRTRGGTSGEQKLPPTLKKTNSRQRSNPIFYVTMYEWVVECSSCCIMFLNSLYFKWVPFEAMTYFYSFVKC